MRIAYLIDPPGSLKPATDSSVELIRTHALRGDEVLVVTRDGVTCAENGTWLKCFPVEVRDNDDDWFELGKPSAVPATELDAIAIRLEPPVDDSYVKICQLLTLALQAGVTVANDPLSIVCRDEKISALNYPDLIPRTLVSTDRPALLGFISSLDGGCMVKPVGNMGGQGVFSFGQGDSNVPVALDLMLKSGKTVLAQERLPGISEGDRRVFVIGGKPYGHMLNRIPAQGSHLGNMVAGGKPIAMEIGQVERSVCERIGPDLLAAGIYFAGVDVIDGKLTEINITCPTGLRTVRDQSGLRPAEDVIDAIVAAP